VSDYGKLLDGKVAIVAGGARGIGRACALRLADLGANTAVLDVNLAGASEYGEQIGAPTVEDEIRQHSVDGLGIQCNLSEPGATNHAIATVVGRWGRLDILVVPAGGAITSYPNSLASLTPDGDLSTLVDANMRTVVNSCRAAVPEIRRAGGGAIVTIASGSGTVTMPGGYLAAYGMVKAAVMHYTRYLAVEVGPSGIRVNCIAPGVIRTARLIAQSVVTGIVNDEAAAQLPLRRHGETSDIADAVQYLVTPLSSWMTGQVLAVDGGATMR
jgi:3-oxoacyl-[acyl-carrier protein] reductase